MEKAVQKKKPEGENNKLVEVAIERSFDVVEKGWSGRVFIKVHISARTDGLLAAISDKDFKTLLTIGTFMDAGGRCYPSQDALAQALGITRPAVAKRVKSLAAFRWKGKPLISVQKVRTLNGRFENTVYTVHDGSSLKFGNGGGSSHVNASHMAGGNTNKNQDRNGNDNSVTEMKESFASGRERDRCPDEPMALQLASEMNDTKNLAYYRHVVLRLPARIYLRVRGEVLEERKIKKSRGAMFAHLLKKYTGRL